MMITSFIVLDVESYASPLLLDLEDELHTWKEVPTGNRVSHKKRVASLADVPHSKSPWLGQHSEASTQRVRMQPR